MEIGLGLDLSVGLTLGEEAQLSKEAAELGYKQIWTPDGPRGDAFQTCLMRWLATCDAIEGGVTVGIGVSPVALRSPMAFAMSAGMLSHVTGGRFILGLGSGGADVPEYRRTWNVHGSSALELVREYVTTIRGLLRGETVEYTGGSIELHGAQLDMKPPQNPPIYIGGLGPEMLRLGGELADGLCLNWSTPAQVARARESIAEGARRAGRDPSDVKVCAYIRVCVDEDVDKARRAYVRAMMGYALGEFGAPPRGYRAHFERMGFADELRAIDELRARNAPVDEQVDAFPPEVGLAMGYFGNAAGAAGHFRSIAEGLDVALVRIVVCEPGIEAARAAITACAPVLALQEGGSP